VPVSQACGPLDDESPAPFRGGQIVPFVGTPSVGTNGTITPHMAAFLIITRWFGPPVETEGQVRNPTTPAPLAVTGAWSSEWTAQL